jgi:hypothetical protein
MDLRSGRDAHGFEVGVVDEVEGAGVVDVVPDGEDVLGVVAPPAPLPAAEPAPEAAGAVEVGAGAGATFGVGRGTESET